jgi:phenylalanine-4-hydroxylase
LFISIIKACFLHEAGLFVLIVKVTAMKQRYNQYTTEDHQVWSVMFERQMKALPRLATNEFMKGIALSGFEPHRIPEFSMVNERLMPLTGWQIYEVPGIVADDEFFRLLTEKKFPATTWIRKMSELEYIEEPDMFHDVFGHVPLLTNALYCHFLEAMSQIALEHINDPHAIELMSRLYWYTVEFGLMREDGELKIYGAGLLSSIGETLFSLQSEEPARAKFDMAAIFNTPYIKEKYQEKYFIVDGFEQLYDSIGSIRQLLNEQLATVKAGEEL